MKKLIPLLFIFAILPTTSSFANSVPEGYAKSAEMRLNLNTYGEQNLPALASNGTNYLCAWQDGDWRASGLDYSYSGIFGRIISADGSLSGMEFRINSYTTGYQTNVTLHSAGGNYLAVWESNNSTDPNHGGLFGCIISADGSSVGQEFKISSNPNSIYEYSPSITSYAGEYIVSWHGPTDGDNNGIFGQRLSAEGSRIGDIFQINSYTTSAQALVSITAGKNNFLAVWNSPQDNSLNSVIGRLFYYDGTPAGNEFLINQYTNGNQENPYVASTGNNFLIAWESNYQDGSDMGIFGRLISNDGSFITDEFQINSFTRSDQEYPAIAVMGDKYIVVWDSGRYGYAGADGDHKAVCARIMNDNGDFLTDEFVVNTYTESAQSFPSIAVLQNQFIIAWSSFYQDGNWNGIYATQYTYTAPEPATILLILSSLAGFAHKRKKLL